MTGEAKHPSTDEQPLEDITVLDASRVLAGPFATMQLGDLGADIIKIERPGVGDQTRGWKPPTYRDSEESAYYLSINRNKRSITLDLSSETGQSIFRRIAAEADVVVENFRPGKMEEWGLGYEDLKRDNPGLIYAKITGYGEWGPDRDRPAYDIIMQAEGGLMSITGEEGGDPVRVGVAIADLGAGHYTVQGILSALLYRELDEEGRGQKVDVSLLDGQAAWMSYMAAYYFATGAPPGRMGSKHPTIAPYQAFETRDGHVVIAVASEHIWPRFCRAIEREDLIDDERFATNEDRVDHRGQLDSLLEAEFGQYETAAILARLSEYDVPASPVRDMEAVFENPQILARNMKTAIDDHPHIENLELPGSPMHFSMTPTTDPRHPPTLGEDTEAILTEYGYTSDQVETFEEDDIV